ncbi:hypothetical protein ACGFX4_01545 [Kitasatospora sp. NPDC048365]|uniref:hypothetical protein n=1 Tax=Kitasatospora sp. NPDC048365 TaxID=3364050 RepID=UPI0037114614
MTRRPVGLSLILAAAALVTAACAQPSGRASAEPEVPAFPTLLDARRVVYPLQSYDVDAARHRELEKAQDALIDQCMQRFGFRFAPRPAGPDGEEENSRRYGLTDASVAARDGYAVPPGEKPTRSTPAPGSDEALALFGEEKLAPSALPRNQQDAERSGGSERVLGGARVPVGGCLTESRLKLFAPAADTVDPQLVFNLAVQAYNDSKADSRVRAAVAAWSSCLAHAGFHAENPVSPLKELGLTPASANAPEAVAAAEADVACKREVNLVGIWSTVEVAYQKRQIERNGEVLRRARGQLDERLKLAAALTR